MYPKGTDLRHKQGEGWMCAVYDIQATFFLPGMDTRFALFFNLCRAEQQTLFAKPFKLKN